MICINFCNDYFKFMINCLVNSVHYSSSKFFKETICLAQRKTPITRLYHQSASLNNVTATTQWNLHISLRDRLKHCKTTCINSLALRSDKPEIETKWGRHDSAVRSQTAPQELH